MLAFFIPLINGKYSLEFHDIVQLPEKPWYEVRELALKQYSDNYVSEMMDGRGYIEIRTDNGMLRYIQEPDD